jgi:hypothetical protein
MTKSTAALVVLLCSAAVSCGKADNASPKDPLEPPPMWEVSLNTGGFFGAKFDIDLYQTGTLEVVRQDAKESSTDSVVSRSFSTKLSPADTREIYERARTILKEFRFLESNPQLNDGTRITLEISSYDRRLKASYRVGQAEKEVPDVVALIALINKHLPVEFRAY